eukprot:TRINITY_DN5759_c0_g2_i2.p1 TRINITY_DN5759_c0_g2~~TRINITY_DN5759_c0_g2_i2.p1  ORF type:complete len:151 (-),score=9.22 TRINITY_DN5759_c0_g2_i2:105-557(-)
MANARTQTFESTIKFRCRPEDMYSCWLDSRIVSTFTHSPAEIDARVGGSFSLFGGSIRGEFVELVPGQKIVQKWRFTDWHDDQYSLVTLDLSSPSYGVCVVQLTHTGIPLEDRFGNHDVPRKVQDGWKEKFWENIRRILGFSYVEDDDDD